jgi:dihydroorotate dehydrogenase
MSWLDRLALPALRLLPPETAHAVTLAALKSGLPAAAPATTDALLRVRFAGMDFINPIGLAAGFDKNAEVPDAMLAQGFGFVEVGSLTPRPQAGNPRPRVFRLTGDGAVINRLGFNNAGVADAEARLRARPRRGIVGVNIGANADSADRIADYCMGLGALGPYADYVTVNVSSPNTPGLRGLQEKAVLEDLVDQLFAVRDDSGLVLPILLKIAPDLGDGELADIAEVALEKGLDGIVVSNTTIDRPPDLADKHRDEAGGLSGRPLMAPSTRILARMHCLTAGRIALVGVGGVASGADAFAKICAGATLVQLYTALIFQGPGLVRRINRDLAALLRSHGFDSLEAAVGSADENGA